MMFFTCLQCCDDMYRKENAMECFPVVDSETGACQEYMRSAIGLKPGCALGPREQVRITFMELAWARKRKERGKQVV